MSRIDHFVDIKHYSQVSTIYRIYSSTTYQECKEGIRSQGKTFILPLGGCVACGTVDVPSKNDCVAARKREDDREEGVSDGK